MLLTSVVNLIPDDASEIANLASQNGIIGTFLYFVGIMAIVIFIGAFLTSGKDSA